MAGGELTRSERGAPIFPLDTRQVAGAMVIYQEGLKSILADSDWQEFQERRSGESRRFLKRSGWRKIAFWFGLDLEVLSSTVERDGDGAPLRARAVARATHPNGRHADGDGYCALGERRFSKPENDIPATAVTRAMNRAISNLVGMGEVSAEEVEGGEGLPGVNGPPASQPEIDGAWRALVVLHGGAAASEEELMAELVNDAGGYLPRAVARALMLVAAAVVRATSAQPVATSPVQAEHDAAVAVEGSESAAEEAT